MNLLAIRDPFGISSPGRPGDFGLGDPFEFPFETVEALLPLDRERLLVLNDNNYPYTNGRNADHPDDNEMIVVRIDALCQAPVTPPPAQNPPLTSASPTSARPQPTRIAAILRSPPSARARAASVSGGAPPVSSHGERCGAEPCSGSHYPSRDG